MAHYFSTKNFHFTKIENWLKTSLFISILLIGLTIIVEIEVVISVAMVDGVTDHEKLILFRGNNIESRFTFATVTLVSIIVSINLFVYWFYHNYRKFKKLHPGVLRFPSSRIIILFILPICTPLAYQVTQELAALVGTSDEERTANLSFTRNWWRVLITALTIIYLFSELSKYTLSTSNYLWYKSIFLLGLSLFAYQCYMCSKYIKLVHQEIKLQPSNSI